MLNYFLIWSWMVVSPYQSVTLSAPAETPLGTPIVIKWDKVIGQSDFITIVPKGTAEGTYESYEYAKKNSWEINAPDQEGDYEIRYLSGESGYPTLARKALKVTPVSSSLEAPASVVAGSAIEVRWEGPNGQGDFITIVEPNRPEGEYGHYVYTKKGNPISIPAPDVPGEYELRYATGKTYRTLARARVKVGGASASLEAPAVAVAGSKIEIAWTGPDNAGDFLTIVKKGAPEKTYNDYVYTKKGSPIEMTAPEESGDYEIRYLTGGSEITLTSIPLQVGGSEATVSIADKVTAGSEVAVTWTGPDNSGDYLTIVPEGAPQGTYEKYVYTKAGSPATMMAPETPGRFEVRYLSARKGFILAKMAFEVTAVTASLKAPKEAVAGTVIDIGWEGPGNRYDYISIAPPNSPNDDWSRYQYIHDYNPLAFTLPIEPGDYELRYATGQTSTILARFKIKVTPAALEPGSLRVVWDSQDRMNLGSDVGLELILDASGSMLQRLEGKRRIEIAKAVLTDLVTQKVPAGTPVAIRVFGHKEADSCRTDLEMPLSELDPAKAASLIGKIQAMNLAKTPIADSLAQVANDLAGVKGMRLVVLITDGEETCGGDPAEAIRRLKEQGIDVRVNIVGFAIDDQSLKQSFKLWAELGDGDYFDASGAEQLSQSLASALQIPFDIFNGQGQKVAEGLVGGPAVAIPAGTYEIRTRETNPRTLKAVEVSPKQEQTATLR